MNAMVSALIRGVAKKTDFDLRILHHRLALQTGANSIAASAVLSLHDSPGAPDDFLLDLVAPLIERCRVETLPILRQRNAPEWCFCWPGEHYRFLAAIAAQRRPRTVVEIGTGTGLSLLSLLPRLDPEAEVLTVDIIPWNAMTDCMGTARGSFLREEDFRSGRVRQVVGDLTDDAVFASVADTLRRAELIFIDGPKDGVFETRFLRRMNAAEFRSGALVVLDDIRFFSMLEIWRRIGQPKLDLTSLGHFSGTGVVHWL